MENKSANLAAADNANANDSSATVNTTPVHLPPEW